MADSPSGPHDWLPTGFVAPLRDDLPSIGLHLRPIRAEDTEIDMIAVMGSRERLWSIFGEAWGWPAPTLTADADREDLARHADEMTRNESFNYALLNADESELVGCVYIDPPEKVGDAGAEISWWVVDSCVDTPVEQAIDAFVPDWIATEWPVIRPRYVGLDLTWSDWIALDDLPWVAE